MKFIIYLPLFTSALLLSWYLFSGDESTTPTAQIAPAYVEQVAGSPAPLLIQHDNTAVPPASELPPSVRGTSVDGQLAVDAHGNLLITSQIRHLFDYFLSLIGEESSAAATQRIRHYLTEQLAEPALGQALAMLDTYLDYQQQLAELESRFPVSESLDDLLAREQAVQRLRASLFSREVHEAFFAGEEIYNHFNLERLAIQHDSSMDEPQKALAIEALRENLPDEMQQLLVPQIQNDLREQTLALREAGAGEAAVRQLRMGLLGPEATERLEALDQRRAEWRQRVDRFNQERDSLLAHPGLADNERQAAVNALLQEQFTETERLRL
ncbi:MAG: lipase secretion chaperone [Pseudomonas sp.]